MKRALVCSFRITEEDTGKYAVDETQRIRSFVLALFSKTVVEASEMAGIRPEEGRVWLELPEAIVYGVYVVGQMQRLAEMCGAVLAVPQDAGFRLMPVVASMGGGIGEVKGAFDEQ